MYIKNELTPISVIVLAIILLILAILFAIFRRIADGESDKSPNKSTPAIITSLHIEYITSKNLPTQVNIVKFTIPDGKLIEIRVPPEIFADLYEGDYGILTVKSRKFISFAKQEQQQIPTQKQ